MSCIFRGRVSIKTNIEANLYISVYCRSVQKSMAKKQLFWLNLLLVLILNFISIIISISTFYSKMDILKNTAHNDILLCIDIFHRWKPIFFLKKCTSLFYIVLKRSTINFACIFNNLKFRVYFQLNRISGKRHISKRSWPIQPQRTWHY